MALYKPLVMIGGRPNELPTDDALVVSPAETSTGTEIFFDKPQRHYGQTAALTGSLTMDTTGAINGATVIIRYNAATMGSVPGSWIRLKNDFVASTDVVIVAVRFSSSIVYYTISKAV